MAKFGNKQFERGQILKKKNGPNKAKVFLQNFLTKFF